MRHVQLIAISGSIGSALFIAIGIPFTSGGPLGLLIGMALWCTVVWASANCLIEITTLLPVDGGFIGYATRFVDESFGMALGWNVSAVHRGTSAPPPRSDRGLEVTSLTAVHHHAVRADLL